MSKELRMRRWIPYGVLAVGMAGCDTGAPPPTHTRAHEVSGDDDEAVESQSLTSDSKDGSAELVFELVRTLDAKGQEVGRTSAGAIDRHIWRKAARPDPLRDGELLYQEESRLDVDAEGNRRATTSFTSRVNTAHPEMANEPSAVVLDVPLLPRENGLVYVSVALAEFPEWDVPLELPTGLLPVEEERAGAEERTDGFAMRQALFDEMGVPVEELVLSLGGELGDASWTSGWVGALLPEARVAELASSPLVRQILPLDGELAMNGWRVGEAGQASRYNTVSLRNYVDGAGATIGVIELGLLDDEACFLYDGAGCTGASRLLSRAQCDDPSPILPGYCDNVTDLDDFHDSLTVVQHATTVVGLAAADYRGHQGTGYALGDDAWTSGAHTATWETRATTLAPEVNVRFTGSIGTTAEGVEAIDDMSASSAKIINLSWYSGSSRCRGTPANAIGESIENAFDDAKLVVIAAGNDPDRDDSAFGPCEVVNGADLPKAFAVNALAASGCESDYQSQCQVNVASAANGGGDAITPDGVTHAGALSMISMAAVDGASYRSDTECNTSTSRGLVHDEVPGATCGDSGLGSSFAAPVVASAAALVFEWGTLSFGSSAMSATGRLQTLMLGMGDSHRLTAVGLPTTQGTTRADRRFGMGRLKTKTPSYAYLTTTALTDTANQFSTWAWTGALPAGYDFVKCVALQHEDMTFAKTRVSDADLQVQLHNAGAGGTCLSGTSLYASTTDTGYDVKSMVALRSSAIAGKCVRVTLNANDVYGAAMSASLYCYASTEDDDEPN